MLIIAAGKNAFINKHILSNKIIVFLGLISYPLYLWHWPLLSFAFICEGQNPALWIRLSAITLAVICAVITYFFIENPLRYGKFVKIKALCLFLTLLLVGLSGYKVYATNGFEQRFYKDRLLQKADIELSKKTELELNKKNL